MVATRSKSLMCMVAGWTCLAAASLCSASPPIVELAPQTKPRLDGKWQVSSASYKTTGPIYYTFRGDTLAIETQQAADKRLGTPQRISVTKWRIIIDETKSPSRLIMTKLDGDEATNVKRIEAFDFRKGELWMCRDSGDPITPEMLHPGKCGWLTGLTKIK